MKRILYGDPKLKRLVVGKKQIKYKKVESTKNVDVWKKIKDRYKKPYVNKVYKKS